MYDVTLSQQQVPPPPDINTHSFDLKEAVPSGVCTSIIFRQRLVRDFCLRCKYHLGLLVTFALSCRWEIQNPSNMHLIASTEEFRERIRLAKGENTLVVVDYFAPWCHACKCLHPKLQNLARSYRHVTFLSSCQKVAGEQTDRPFRLYSQITSCFM